MAEEAIRKSIVRVNTLLECWGFTNSPRYHVDIFNAYRNHIDKIYPNVAYHVKHSIQEYAQQKLSLGGNMGPKANQGLWGNTVSTTTRSTFTERMAQLTQSWKEEFFRDIYHAFLICKIFNFSTSRFVSAACIEAIKSKLEKSIGDIRKRDFKKQGEEFNTVKYFKGQE